MFKRIFTSEQLTRFFQIAVIINLIGLLSDVVVYRYFSDYEILKRINENLSNLSIFIVCLIVISQAIFIFIENHKKLSSRYKLLAIASIICISTFFLWLLNIDNDMQENFIIFCSSTSRTDHNNRAIVALIGILTMLILNFYHTLKKADDVNDETIPQMIRSVFRLVVRKYLLIFIAFFGIFHLEKLHNFAMKLFHDGQESIFFDLKLAEILIPIAWIAAVIYYLYQHWYLPKE